MIISNLLDVCNLTTQEKIRTIFEYFDALSEGESFIIKNNHDPKPLYFQLLTEKGDGFQWEYLESGPQIWQVRIGRTHVSKAEETIGEIAAKDIRNASLLKSLGIDFCCGGKQTLAEAAASIELTESELQLKLAQAAKIEAPTNYLNFESWELDFLAAYIKNVHHYYIREHGPVISNLANRVAMVHASEQPELVTFAKEVDVFLAELYNHIDTEEKQLFPGAHNLSMLTTEHACQLVQYLRYEHGDLGDELQELRRITNNYVPPKNACYSYISLHAQLKALENDLLQYIHLEINILFPKLLKTYDPPLDSKTIYEDEGISSI